MTKSHGDHRSDIKCTEKIELFGTFSDSRGRDGETVYDRISTGLTLFNLFSLCLE